MSDPEVLAVGPLGEALGPPTLGLVPLIDVPVAVTVPPLLPLVLLAMTVAAPVLCKRVITGVPSCVVKINPAPRPVPVRVPVAAAAVPVGVLPAPPAPSASPLVYASHALL